MNTRFAMSSTVLLSYIHLMVFIRQFTHTLKLFRLKKCNDFTTHACYLWCSVKSKNEKHFNYSCCGSSFIHSSNLTHARQNWSKQMEGRLLHDSLYLHSMYICKTHSMAKMTITLLYQLVFIVIFAIEYRVNTFTM